MKYLTKSILGMKPRKKSAHKGDFGKVLVIAGSEDFPGAAKLAAGAAISVLRSGADLVTVAAPSKVAWVINTSSPDIITKKMPGKYFALRSADNIIKQAKDFDVVLIGPGIGKKSNQFIRKVIKQIKKPKVIDADALKAIKLQEVQNAILTPHKTELKILLKNSRLNENNFRNKINNNIILIKGNVDKIISKSKIVYNKTGNAVMTKGGTGDVLAGLCAGFVAQTNNLFKSACMAAYLNGKVGDYLLKRYGRTFVASDLINNMHKIFK